MAKTADTHTHTQKRNVDVIYKRKNIDTHRERERDYYCTFNQTSIESDRARDRACGGDAILVRIPSGTDFYFVGRD